MTTSSNASACLINQSFPIVPTTQAPISPTCIYSHTINVSPFETVNTSFLPPSLPINRPSIFVLKQKGRRKKKNTAKPSQYPLPVYCVFLTDVSVGLLHSHSAQNTVQADTVTAMPAIHTQAAEMSHDRVYSSCAKWRIVTLYFSSRYVRKGRL